MQINPVAKSNAPAGRNGQSAGSFVRQAFEIMLAKRIGREQAVIAHMPPGGMPRVLRMIENRDADSLSSHGAVIITPVGAFAPGLSVANSGAVNDVTFAGFSFETHRFGQA